MAQQTQIDRVAARWPELMSRFPTPESLSSSDEQEILSLWQGLGYYRRAKNLKQSAEVMTQNFAGEVPSEVNELLSLPGVGKYTAGAVASIAFDKRVPIVDTNVHRVLCRLFNNSNEPIPSKWTWDMAEELVKVCRSPKIFNEGLMEFGAVICTPKSPECNGCPMQSKCEAYGKGLQNQIPKPKKSLPRKQEHHYAVVVQSGEELGFEQRSSKGLWADMWQVPTVDSSRTLNKHEVSEMLQLESELSRIGSFEHILSHRIISFTVFSCRMSRDSRFTWLKSEDLAELPLASAQRKVLAVHCVT
ncbi:MAG: A/G-specific adenine glycosylase [Planctomycetes bacterium]|nr:A/G-specific adenine glycosylase [Planctomycetota bacterium]